MLLRGALCVQLFVILNAGDSLETFRSWGEKLMAQRSSATGTEIRRKCVYLTHNSPQENTVQNLGSCGQNLFVAAQKTPWFFAIKSWFLEYRNFTYGDPNLDLKTVGHYTQMVWATSHKVGCGIAHCPSGPWGQFYNYVCHYCPGGNYVTKTHYPYKKGQPCEDCPNDCANNLCTNSCSRKDVFSNCDELFSLTQSICSQGTCNATCECGNERIHKNYPW